MKTRRKKGSIWILLYRGRLGIPAGYGRCVRLARSGNVIKSKRAGITSVCGDKVCGDKCAFLIHKKLFNFFPGDFFVSSGNFFRSLQVSLFECHRVTSDYAVVPLYSIVSVIQTFNREIFRSAGMLIFILHIFPVNFSYLKRCRFFVEAVLFIIIFVYSF